MSPIKPLTLMILMALITGLPGQVMAESTGSEAKKVVATIDSQSIAMAELEAHLEEPLRRLDIERRRILESGLSQLVEQRLLGLEAEKRGQSVEALLTEGAAPIDDAAIDAFYEANKARIGQPKEQIAPQIRQYLVAQQAQQKRAQLVTELRGRHQVSMLLEPYRAPMPASDAPIRGLENAPVELTVFSDFQCPGCRGIEPVLDAVREANGENLKVVFRQYPLTSIHPEAFQAAEAALCAGDQGKFWEMHGALFADQRSLARSDLDNRAATLELDQKAFSACLDSGEKKMLVERDLRLGREIGVSGTPTLFINGRPVDLGNLQGSPQAVIQALIDDELNRRKL